jgi:hypothetical protein
MSSVCLDDAMTVTSAMIGYCVLVDTMGLNTMLEGRGKDGFRQG